MNAAIEWLGRLHPLVVHFPIALACVAATAECVALRRDYEFAAYMVTWAVGSAAVFAVLAGVTGWILAAHEHIRSDERVTLEWHRWLEVAATVFLVAAALAAARCKHAPKTGALWLRRGLVWVSAALLMIASHMGASLVWGDDWLF